MQPPKDDRGASASGSHRAPAEVPEVTYDDALVPDGAEVSQQTNGARVIASGTQATIDDVWDDEVFDEAESSMWSVPGLKRVVGLDAGETGSMRAMQIGELSREHRFERTRMVVVVAAASFALSLAVNALYLLVGSGALWTLLGVGPVIGFAVRSVGTTRGSGLKQLTAVFATYAVIASTWVQWFYDMKVNPHLYVPDPAGGVWAMFTQGIGGYQGRGALGSPLAHLTVPFGADTFQAAAAVEAVGKAALLPVPLVQLNLIPGMVVLILALILAQRTVASSR